MTEKQIMQLKLELASIDYAYARSDLFDAKQRIAELEFAVKALLYQISEYEELTESKAVKYAKKVLT